MTARSPLSGQIPLDLDWPRRSSFRRDDWIATPANERALALAEGTVPLTGFAAAIFGPEASGKSHLASIWADRVGGSRLDLETFAEAEVRSIGEAHPMLVVEDFEQFLRRVPDRASAERAMHHLYNIIGEVGGQLFFASREPPARWSIDLPDLKSRLSSIPSFPIERPDDALLPKLIARLFENRALQVEDDVIEFLASRTRRGYRPIAELVETLDAANLDRQRRITVPFVRKILAW